MRNKAFLPLFELIIMIGIFAAAAAICLSVFVKADAISQKAENLDRAVEAAENAAEIIKYTRGDLDALSDTVSAYEEGYNLKIVAVNRGEGYLGLTDITVYSGNEPIFELTVGWQKEARDGN